MKNGARPIAGSALTTPPPVSSSVSRSSEIVICGLLRPADALRSVGEIVHVDHGGLDTCRREVIQPMIEQRLAGDRHQRLRHPFRQRPHPLAAACGEHHGGAGRVRHEFFLF